LNKGLALHGTLPALFLFTGVDAEVQGAVASLINWIVGLEAAIN
jgi:hypothetical protein